MTDKLLNKLLKSSIPKDELGSFSKTLNSDEYYECLKASGVSLDTKNGNVVLKTINLKIKDEIFCIVDIETNGAKKEYLKIIEVGAIKIKNFEIIDMFQSLIHADYVNFYVSEITGLYKEDLADAPSEKVILTKFKEFLGESTFVAHNVRFDLTTISSALSKLGLGVLNNRALCTLDLARRSIDSPKYGLAYLREFLNINEGVHHRALDDVKSTLEVFKHSIAKIPEKIKKVEELIEFSKKTKMIRPKKQMKKMSCELATVNSEDMIEVFESIQNIAFVGLSPKEEKASNKVARYFQEQGYKIFPIYPKEEFILNEKVYKSLNDIEEKVDMVVMFRKAEFADVVVEKLELRKENMNDVKVLWLQLGIVNNKASQKAESLGLKVVQNKCSMIEHKAINSEY